MENLHDFIREWKNTGRIGPLIAAGLDLPDTTDARRNLQNMEAPARREMYRALREIGDALASEIEKLRLKIKKSNDERDRNARHATACLAYHRQGRFCALSLRRPS